MKWKGFGSKWSWTNFEVLSLRSPGGTEEDHKNFIKDVRSLGRYLNLGPPEHEAGALATRQ
jgi:hypothetical protein